MPQPEEPGYIYFLDRSLGSNLVADALREAGVAVELHGDHFEHDAQDPEWIPEVAERGWIILAKDLRIRWRPLERQAIQASGARVFVFSSGNATGDEMAEAFVQAIPRIQRVLDRYRGPFIAKVYRDGAARMWMDWSGDV